MRGTVQARFGGEGLVLLGNQDAASSPTLFDVFAPTGVIYPKNRLFLRLLVPLIAEL